MGSSRPARQACGFEAHARMIRRRFQPSRSASATHGVGEEAGEARAGHARRVVSETAMSAIPAFEAIARERFRAHGVFSVLRRPSRNPRAARPTATYRGGGASRTRSAPAWTVTWRGGWSMSASPPTPAGTRRPRADLEPGIPPCQGPRRPSRRLHLPGPPSPRCPACRGRSGRVPEPSGRASPRWGYPRTRRRSCRKTSPRSRRGAQASPRPRSWRRPTRTR